VVRATGLFHATLPVWDLERAERFWYDLLGIRRHATPSYFPARVVFLDLGNTMIHLVRYGDEIPRPHPRSTHVAIETISRPPMRRSRPPAANYSRRSPPGPTCAASTSSIPRAIGLS